MADDLIERWVAGDGRAADELYRRYHHRVKDFAIRLGAKIVDADDVAQEALIAGLEGLKTGARPERLTYWLLGIARKINSRRPRGGREDEAKILDTARSAGTQAARREMHDLLDRSVEKLPAACREVLDLHHRANLSRRQIADKLALPMEAVHARIERAYARLREGLSRHFTTMALARCAAVTLEDVEKLRPTFREAVTLRHLEGQTESHAATKLGIPLATLRARLQSACELLKCGGDADFTAAREEYRRSRGRGEPPRTP